MKITRRQFLQYCTSFDLRWHPRMKPLRLVGDPVDRIVCGRFSTVSPPDLGYGKPLIVRMEGFVPNPYANNHRLANPCLSQPDLCNSYSNEGGRYSTSPFFSMNSANVCRREEIIKISCYIQFLPGPPLLRLSLGHSSEGTM